MKTTNINSACSICHDVIETQHVFSENNQVYVKKNNPDVSDEIGYEGEWTPINFYWIADLKVRTNLNNQPIRGLR